MKPKLGWVLLSREALSRAETQLRDDIMGVRDEVGFLLLHSAYANRFFPGTSVLHTRLRYVLFIPWIYLDLIRHSSREDISQQVVNAETFLAGRLLHQDGTIGKRGYPNPTSQQPTMAYWTALGTWGILKPRPDGSWPSKSQIHRTIRSEKVITHMQDDDGRPLDEVQELFIALPPLPSKWKEQRERLSFRLLKRERMFLKRQLIGVMRKDEPLTPSLLSRLAEGINELNDDISDFPWSPAIKRHADAEDKAALIRASQVAALSAVGRGVYAAMVEELREKEDGANPGQKHRQHLREVINQYSTSAKSLQLEKLTHDINYLPPYLNNVLIATQEWLSKPKSVLVLRDAYAKAEDVRKGRRARLNRTLFAKQRRAEWDPEEQTLATPIHYRWFNIRRLLRDLKGVA